MENESGKCEGIAPDTLSPRTLSLKDCKSIKKKQSQQKTQHNGENT